MGIVLQLKIVKVIPLQICLMKKKLIRVALPLLLACTFQPSYAFLGGFTEALKKAQQGVGAPMGGGPSGSQASADAFNSTCKQVLGAPFKEKTLSAPVDQVVGRYFKVAADTESKLMSGINKSYMGTMVKVSAHVADIKDQTIRDLAESFVANPSMSVLAQIIQYAENGDGYQDGDNPSERTEAQTLLAMVIMQYPELASNKGMASDLLRKSSLANSGLGLALIARAHLFGDFANKDITTFSNYIGRASSQYPVKLADQSIFYALEKIPNWQYRKQYLDLLQQSQQMTADFNRQREAAK